ncbi:hypothetical protein HYV44_00355 [Candidatus Microgenomates bacterium]|nr:hypothetical protein [Candidatus Microgenomates bacterium]
MKVFFISIFFIILSLTTFLVVRLTLGDKAITPEKIQKEILKNASPEIQKIISDQQKNTFTPTPEKNTPTPESKSSDPGPAQTVNISTCTQLMEKVNLQNIFDAYLDGSFQITYAYPTSNQCIIKVLTPNPNYPNGAYVDFARVNIGPVSLYNTKSSGGITVVDDTGTTDQIGSKSAHYTVINQKDISSYDQMSVRFVPSTNPNIYIQVYFWGVNLQGLSGQLPQASLLTLNNVTTVAQRINEEMR